MKHTVGASSITRIRLTDAQAWAFESLSDAERIDKNRLEIPDLTYYQAEAFVSLSVAERIIGNIDKIRNLITYAQAWAFGRLSDDDERKIDNIHEIRTLTDAHAGAFARLSDAAERIIETMKLISLLSEGQAEYICTNCDSNSLLGYITSLTEEYGLDAIKTFIGRV